LGTECQIDTRLVAWWASRVETARISLKHMRRLRLAPRTAHAPDLGRSSTGSALSALWKAGSGFSVEMLRAASEAAPRCSGRSPKCHGSARRAQWPASIVAVAAYHPLPRPPWAAISRCARRYPWASPGGPIEWLGRLKFVPTPEEGDFGILEAARPDLLLQDPMASEPPPAWAPRVRLGPGIDSGLPSRVRRSRGMLCTDLGAVVCVSFRPAVGRGGNQPTLRRAPIEDARAGRGWWDLGRRVEPWACSASFRARGRWGGTNRGISVFCIPPQNIPAARSRASTVGFTLLSHSYRTTLYLCVDEVPAPRSRPTTAPSQAGEPNGGL